jgi:Amt family ammonium transporter
MKYGPSEGVGLVEVINCVLTGLVAITAGCNVVSPWAAGFIGLMSTLVFLNFDRFARDKLLIDDPLGAYVQLILLLLLLILIFRFAVHAGGGMWGLISAGLFAYSEDGVSSLFYGDFHQVRVLLCYCRAPN